MFCPSCGTQNPDGAPQCTNCGRSFVQQQQKSALDEPGIGLLIPVRPEPVSLIAGYVGLAGFLLCGLPGPLAIGLGIWGLYRIKANPELKGKSRAIVGIALGIVQTILILVVVVGGLLNNP